MPHSDERPTLPDEPAPPTEPEGPPAPWRLDRYEVIFELARGGMGSVYVARLRGAHRFDRLVAIKKLSAYRTRTSDIRAFLDEARLTARIHHPNVVQTLDLGEDDGAPFLVMQLVQGVSLAQLLARLAVMRERLDPDVAAWIVAQAAAGLHAAHELAGEDGEPLHLVHRDISPQNVLLSYEGRVHVADFGVAKFTERDVSTQSGIVKGKFRYMSPEQTRAEALDRRSDLFSLGIVLYEALTARRPFDADAPANVVLQIVTSEPSDPVALRPDIPEALATIAMRCLAKRPGDRWSSAAELADALRKHLRARRAVDETDLAALLERAFASERRSFEERLRSGASAESAVRRAGEALASSEPASVQASQVSITEPRVVRARTVRRVAMLGLVAGVAVGFWAAWPKRAPAPPSTSAADRPPPPPVDSAAPVASVAPTASTAQAEAPQVPPSPTAVASNAPPQSPRGTRRRAAGRDAGASAASPTPAPPPTAKPSASAVPFDSL